MRTPLQKKADQIDCDLFRVLSRVEALYDEHKHCSYPRENLSKSLSSLRSARVGLRVLMHESDRKRTW